MNAGPRGKEIYVSARTKKRLFWIRELLKDKSQPPPFANKLTIDDVADTMLNERIEELYPNIKTLEKRLDALEGQLIVELLTPTTET